MDRAILILALLVASAAAARDLAQAPPVAPLAEPVAATMAPQPALGAAHHGPEGSATPEATPAAVAPMSVSGGVWLDTLASQASLSGPWGVANLYSNSCKSGKEATACGTYTSYVSAVTLNSYPVVGSNGKATYCRCQWVNVWSGTLGKGEFHCFVYCQ